jgi:JmjC domain, hydroxylase
LYFLLSSSITLFFFSSYVGSNLHVDPKHTSAWNALVTGRKWWILISPDHSVTDHIETVKDENFHDSENCKNVKIVNTGNEFEFEFENNGNFIDGKISSNYDNVIKINDDVEKSCRPNVVDYTISERGQDEKNNKKEILNIPFWFFKTFPETVKENNNLKSNKKRIFSFIQKEGETVFVPCGWHHAVLNLKTSVSVTHNFVTEKNEKLFLAWVDSNLENFDLDEKEFLVFLSLFERKNIV